jgi:hypothetical protein
MRALDLALPPTGGVAWAIADLRAKVRIVLLHTAGLESITRRQVIHGNLRLMVNT